MLCISRRNDVDQDTQNLNLLGVFHYVLGGLTCLSANLFLIHVWMGLAMVRGTFDGKNSPPDGFGWIFVTMGSVALLFGWALGILMIVAGKNLRRQTLRTFCIVIAAIECVLTPLGSTAGKNIGCLRSTRCSRWGTRCGACAG